MTTPGWTPEDAEALRRLQERQQAAGAPVPAAADPALGSVPAADEAEAEAEPDPGQPDEAGASFPAVAEPAGGSDGVADEAADGPGSDLVTEPGAGPADQGPAGAVTDEAAGPQFEAAEPGPEGDQPVMTAAEAQQSLSAAGAAALPEHELPPFMGQSEAEEGAGEPALPDSATGN